MIKTYCLVSWVIGLMSHMQGYGGPRKTSSLVDLRCLGKTHPFQGHATCDELTDGAWEVEHQTHNPTTQTNHNESTQHLHPKKTQNTSPPQIPPTILDSPTKKTHEPSKHNIGCTNGPIRSSVETRPASRYDKWWFQVNAIRWRSEAWRCGGKAS